MLVRRPAARQVDNSKLSGITARIVSRGAPLRDMVARLGFTRDKTMPFDAAPVLRSPLPNIAAQSALVLYMVESYLRAGAQWAQGIGSETGKRLCLLGAVTFARRELGNHEDRADAYLERAIDLKYPQCRKRLAKAYHRTQRAPQTVDVVTSFNDAPRRTFAQVAAVIHTAKKLAETDARHRP
jgi:hypothetical protein